MGSDLDGAVGDAGGVALDLSSTATTTTTAVVVAAAGTARRHEQRHAGQGDDRPGHRATPVDPHVAPPRPTGY